MPLESGKSHEAFENNVKELISTGKYDQKQALAIAYAKQDEVKDFADTDTHREIDPNGYMTVRDNPIICAGVFQYKGSSLPGADPDLIYNVYRPLEELENPETMASFVGLPIIDEHEMLGERYARSPEERGVHGSILESIMIKGKDVLANLRIWSKTLKTLIDSGKTGLSLGYNCRWEKSSGVFEGMTYNYIQRNIRGNHLALVNQGRNGTEVLDQSDVFDHFDLALDNMESNMAYDDKKDEKMDEKKFEDKDTTEGTELDIDSVHKWAKANMHKFHELVDMMAPDEEKDEVALDGDTKEKSGDQAKDEDDKEEKKEKKEAMDADDIVRLVNSKVKEARASMYSEAGKRDALVKDVTPLIGSFDYAAMDADDVATYAVKKLGLNAKKGMEHAVLTGYIAGTKKSGANEIGFAMDSAIKPKSGGLLSKTLSKAV